MIQWKRTLRNVPGIGGRVGGEPTSSSQDSVLQRAWDAVIDTWKFIALKARYAVRGGRFLDGAYISPHRCLIEGLMEDASDFFDTLPDEVNQLIFQGVCDCKSLVRCMAVSRTFRAHSERVPTLSIACPGEFTSYVDKLQRAFTMVRRFHSLEALVIRVGQPKDEPPSWARCMRYAEIGSSVEKFMFMAAKSGEFSDLDTALRGLPAGEAEASGTHFDEREDLWSRPSDELMYPEVSLRQVLAPSNDVLKRMVPVIVFAIVQGLDEFRESVPAFIHKLKKLKTLIVVDMLESVTVLMREHQIAKIRILQRCEGVQDGVAGGKAAQVSVKGKGKEWLRSTNDITHMQHDSGESSCGVNRKEESGEEDDEAQCSEDEAALGRAEEKTFSNDGAETWRNCRGIYIHGPGDSRGEQASRSSFKRIVRGSRDNRFTRIGSYRRRERSAEWTNESVRRRQESRLHKGLSYRAREESRAFRTWKLDKRERGDEGSYSARSILGARTSSHAGPEEPEMGESSFDPESSANHSDGNSETRASSSDAADRRERLREGVRKRQVEIETEALSFDITFWRAEEVVARNRCTLTDVSMCIATHDSVPLSVSELTMLTCSALAGPLLAATIAHVNEQASFHNL